MQAYLKKKKHDKPKIKSYIRETTNQLDPKKKKNIGETLLRK